MSVYPILNPKQTHIHTHTHTTEPKENKTNLHNQISIQKQQRIINPTQTNTINKSQKQNEKPTTAKDNK